LCDVLTVILYDSLEFGRAKTALAWRQAPNRPAWRADAPDFRNSRHIGRRTVRSARYDGHMPGP